MKKENKKSYSTPCLSACGVEHVELVAVSSGTYAGKSWGDTSEVEPSASSSNYWGNLWGGE